MPFNKIEMVRHSESGINHKSEEYHDPANESL
jgi:hypothetical protein